MNQPIEKYMKLGTILFMSYPWIMKGEGNPSEALRKIACDPDFAAVEVTWVKDPAEREAFKKILRESHLTVAYGAQPRLLTTGYNINDLDEEKRLVALNTLKEGIDEAYEYGARGFAFLSGKYEEATKEESYQALVKSTRELCEYAKSKGNMRVALEVFDYDVDKKSIIGPVDMALRFAKEMCAEYSNFGLMVDLSHLPLLHESAVESLTPIKDYIIHAHMGNAVCPECDPSTPGYGDQHPRFGFPNAANDVDELVEYLRVLFELGFFNTENPPICSFEVKPFGDEDPDILIANSKRVLREAWAKLEI